MPPTSTFLVDDSPSFLQSAARFLAADERIEVVGVALSGQDALEQVAKLKPDLVLMDLNMPGMNGLEATRRLKAEPDPPRVVILTLNDTEEYRQAATEAQADGFVAKSDLGQKLLPLLESLLPSTDSAAPLVPPDSAPPLPTASPRAPSASASTYAVPEAGAPVARVARLGLPLIDKPPVDSLSLDQSNVLPHVFPLPPLPPLADAHLSPSKAADGIGCERPRVLLAEDRAAASHLMAVDMWRSGIETRIAPDALLALELFEIFEPHLVLLDASSPHMRAALICRSIRERSEVPILLLTGRASPGEALGSALRRELSNIEEASSPSEDVPGLTARVLALLSRFYPQA